MPSAAVAADCTYQEEHSEDYADPDCDNEIYDRNTYQAAGDMEEAAEVFTVARDLNPEYETCLSSKLIDNKPEDDGTCPICNESFNNKTKMLDHFKENHMNAIDTNKVQTLSTLITDEAKHIIVKGKTEEMTVEDYDKLLDEYEAKYPETDTSDIEV